MKELGLGITDSQKIEEYWDARPCNIKHSQHPSNTLAFFNEVSERRYRVEPHIPKFADFLNWRDKEVIEIGCGIGTDGAEFARAGAKYTGIDVSAESLRIAKQRFRLEKLEGRFLKGSICEDYLVKELGSHTFDLVYSFGVFHHTSDPLSTIHDASQFVSKGGTMKFMVYAEESWKSNMIDLGLDQPEAQAGCPTALAFDRSSILGLLSGSFETVDIEQDHIFPYQIDAYVRGKLKVEEWIMNLPVGMFERLKKVWGWHLLITCRNKL